MRRQYIRWASFGSLEPLTHPPPSWESYHLGLFRGRSTKQSQGLCLVLLSPFNHFCLGGGLVTLSCPFLFQPCGLCCIHNFVPSGHIAFFWAFGSLDSGEIHPDIKEYEYSSRLRQDLGEGRDPRDAWLNQSLWLVIQNLYTGAFSVKTNIKSTRRAMGLSNGWWRNQIKKWPNKFGMYVGLGRWSFYSNKKHFCMGIFLPWIFFIMDLNTRFLEFSLPYEWGLENAGFVVRLGFWKSFD